MAASSSPRSRRSRGGMLRSRVVVVVAALLDATSAFLWSSGAPAMKTARPTTRSNAELLILHQLPPPFSPYIGPHSDPELLDKFNTSWPKKYVPDPEYPGTCKPGLGRENRPSRELDDSRLPPFEAHAFFEAPFHCRWPAPHPWLPGPYERMERARRFMSEKEIEAAVRAARTRNAAKARALAGAESADGEDATGDVIEGLQTLDRVADDRDGGAAARGDIADDDAVDRDPLFDDQSSDLLDAALGLDDEDAAARRAQAAPPKRPRGRPRKGQEAAPVADDDDDDDDNDDARGPPSSPSDFLVD